MNMNIVPWKRKRNVPVHERAYGNPFEVLHRQINDLFDGFREESGFSIPSVFRGQQDAFSSLTPCFDVSETDAEIKVTAELPGMDEKDIDVTLEDNVLVVKGEKKEEHEEDKKGYYYSERRYGHFQRVIPLPSEIDESKVSANFKNGVLQLSLPKTERAKARTKKIPIKAE
jgi:HSP20 family protein